MVSPVIAQAILNQDAPDILGSFELGRREARQERARTLAGELATGDGTPEQLETLAGLDPELALSMQELIGARSQKDLSDFVQSAGIARRMLESGQTQGALQFANQRLALLKSQGRDTTQTKRIRDLIASGQPDVALAELSAFDEALGKAQQALNVQSSNILPDGTTIQVMKDGSTRVISPQGVELTGQARTNAIREAQQFGVSLQQQAAEARRRPLEKEEELIRRKEQQKQSQELAKAAFDQLPSIRKNILNIDQAIRALDKGAKTGAVERFLPSIRAASVELDNLRGQMGLDVIGSTTFGALSESELNFALDTALPEGLDESELKNWLTRKREAQRKVAEALRDQAKFFSKGGTISELIERDERLKGSDQESLTTVPEATTQPGQIEIIQVRP